MTNLKLHRYPTIAALAADLRAYDLLTGRAPEWAIHLAIARGQLTETEARTALKIGGGL